MTSKFVTAIAFIAPVFIIGCSGILDHDALSEETTNNCGDTENDSCTSNADCDDGIACTVDECQDDGTCYHDPDNDMCDYLDYCDVEDGCTWTGKDCLVDADCVDEVDCTVNRCINWECEYQPDDELCVNEDPCIVNSVCDEVTGCSEGEEMECDQADAGVCEVEICISESGECEPILVDGADDDTDGFLDEICGGDDCDDANPDINPEADEVCNFLDDDCDGFNDLNITVGVGDVSDSSGVTTTQTASNLKRRVVVWQQSDGDTAAVYVRILGTGDCLVDSVCVDIPDSIPASDPINLTVLAGAKSIGMTPSVVSSDGYVFYVVWVAKNGSDNPRVVLVGITPGIDGGAPDIWKQAEPLSDGLAIDVLSPQITWGGNANGWIASWGAEFSGGQVGVELIDQVTHEAGGDVYSGQLAEGEIGDVAIGSLAGNDCVVAYSFNDVPSASFEIHEARFVKVADMWAYEPGWPRVVSDATPGVVDPSYHATITRLSNDDWITTFADLRYFGEETGLDSESDLRYAVGSVPGKVNHLYQDTTFNQSRPGLLTDEGGYGLLYLQQYGDVFTLDFKLLDSGLAVMPDQGARFVLLDEGATVTPGNLTKGADGFETAWIESEQTGETVLRYAGFRGCVQPVE